MNRSLSCVLCFVVLLVALLSCSQRPFLPVNVGREEGNPKTPIVISHLGKNNSWMIKRVKNGHNIFSRVLCFRYVCRAQVGRNKSKKGLSKKEFAQVIENNRERGLYNEPILPKVKTSKKDSVVVAPDVPATSVKPTIAASPEPKADSLITLSEFLFETNSYELDKEHLKELDALSVYILARPSLELTISGHTDNTGDEAHNVTLSTNRAKSVAEYLESKGVAPNKIVFKGLGSEQPITTNDTAEGRSRNRRVEILIRDPR